MTITEIEKLTYKEVEKIAIEKLDIKGHECFIVDFGGYFGYSILVFKDKKHIYYANDYELHHHYLVEQEGKEKLREFYIQTLNHKLYTNEELLEEVQSYEEYQAKDYFLRNYWIMRYDYLSMFRISEVSTRKQNSYPFLNPVCFCYVKDRQIAENAVKYEQHLQKEYKKLQDSIEVFREMVRSELVNHEACITCTAKDALDALGLRYGELSEEKQAIVREELKKQIDRYCA